MLHHASFGVSNIQASSKFYDAVLNVLGYSRVWEDLTLGSDEQAIGYGPPMIDPDGNHIEAVCKSPG